MRTEDEYKKLQSFLTDTDHHVHRWCFGKTVPVADIVKHLKMSEEDINRSLAKLEEMGLIWREKGHILARSAAQARELWLNAQPPKDPTAK